MIDIIIVRYYLDEITFNKKVSLIKRIFANRIGRILVINIGNDDFSSSYIDRSIEKFDFDSKFMDITAYQYGLQMVSNTQSKAYLLLNDTLFLKHPSEYLLSKFSTFKWVDEFEIPIVVGVVDKTCGIIGADTSLIHGQFVSTFAFMLNKEGAKIYGDTVNLAEISSPDRVFSSFLDLHLSAVPNPYSWGKKDNVHILEKKRFCVYFERLLSKRVLSNEGVLIDINSSLFSKIVYRFKDRLKR